MAVFNLVDRVPYGRVWLFFGLASFAAAVAYVMPSNPTVIRINATVLSLSALVAWQYRSSLREFFRGDMKHGPMCILMAVFIFAITTDLVACYSIWSREFGLNVPDWVVILSRELFSIAYLLLAVAPGSTDDGIPPVNWVIGTVVGISGFVIMALID